LKFPSALSPAESLLEHVGRHGGFSHSVSVQTDHRASKGLGVVAIFGNPARLPGCVEHLPNSAQFIRGEHSPEVGVAWENWTGVIIVLGTIKVVHWYLRKKAEDAKPPVAACR
jgi:hypothetical protein